MLSKMYSPALPRHVTKLQRGKEGKGGRGDGGRGQKEEVGRGVASYWPKDFV